jgi:hypothetical protein
LDLRRMRWKIRMMSCGPNLSPPAGYSVWTGYVPPELSQWAVSLLAHVGSYAYGTTWGYAYAGPPALQVIARKDYHTWTHRNGLLVTGCFQGVTLYKPIPKGIASGAPIADPAATAPGTDIATYDAPDETSWPLVIAGAVAIGLTIAGFLYILRGR